MYWFGDTLEILSAYPAEVKRAFGYSIRLVQNGEPPESVKTFQGAIQEIPVWGRDSDYRTYYVASLGSGVYILHVMVKRTSSGLAIAQKDRELILRRFADAQKIDRENK